MKDKEYILNTIAEIISNLGHGNFTELNSLLDSLREKTSYCNEHIQEDILDFIQQVEFQKEYDLEHLVTKEIQESADKLIKDLKKL